MTIRTAARVQSASTFHDGQLDAVPVENTLAALADFLSPPQLDDRASSRPPPAKRRRLHSGLNDNVPEKQDSQNPDERDNREKLSLIRVIVDLPSLKTCHPLENNNSLPARLIRADLSGDQLQLTLQNECRSSKCQFLLFLDLESAMEESLSHLRHIAKVSGSQSRQKSNEPKVLIPKVVFHSQMPDGEAPALDMELFWVTGPTDDERVSERAMRAWPRMEYDIFYSYFSGVLSNGSEDPDPRVPFRLIRHRRPWTVQDFYNCVHVPSKHGSVSLDIPRGMTCDLFPFQKRAVQWMLARESATFSSTASSDEPEDVLPPTFCRTTNHEGRPCFVSLARRMVFTDRDMLEKENLQYGGILCEEMGLGKTVELITLICLHRREIDKKMVYDPYTDSEVVASGATLIVTPAGILEQWLQELARHAPQLKSFHYKGIPAPGRSKPEPDLVQDLLQYDVVLTTYSVLSREIHYTHDGNDRSLRKAKRYVARRSPLVQISWWRCCIDEAQMIESGVSQAAQVASRIPKVIPWAVTGTPVKKRLEDLQGLLLFLRFWPFYRSTVWPSLLFQTRNEIFSRISLRHTKDQVREELRLPPQKRIVMLVPFTPVEEQNYNQLVQDMCQDCEVNAEGMPLYDEEFQNPTRIEKMRTWLTRLRQTCLHPQVGGRNRRALGRRAGPLRTVEEVLNVMIEQNDVQVRSEEREYILAQIVRGHIHGFARSDVRRSEKALEIYRSALKQAERFVEESRRDVAEERKRLERENGSAALESTGVDAEDEEKEGLEASRLNYLRKALRAAVEVQHVCTFFVATAYFNIKTNDDITKPHSEDFKRLEELETEGYNKAQSIRKELLQESHANACREMSKLGKTADSCLSPLPSAQDLGGIENRRILDKLDMVIERLNEQGEKVNEWRKKVIDILSSPLFDAEDEDTTGEEYEASAKAQDELQAYITFLRSVIADRRRLLTGQDGTLAAVEQRQAESHARENKGAAPQLVLRLAFERQQSKSATENVSLQQVVAEIRLLITNFLGGQGGRAAGELAIAQEQLQKVSRMQSQEQKKVVELENEFATYTTCTNSRVEFYRQLQHLSDQLKPYKEELDDELDTAALALQEAGEKRAAERLGDLKKKKRFLQHLKSESQEEDGPRLCVICQEKFELGVLTVCGHQYCKACFRTWFRQHRNCPLCKRRLHSRDYQDITYKPQELRSHEENALAGSAKSSDDADARQSIYAAMSEKMMRAIKSIDINGSFGTKIDTLARHLLWLRENDPGSKSVIFSQYGDFLEVLGDALRQFRIGFSTITDKDGVEKFKRDPSIECFLLDAKSDASGLNLVNASYVFLMEPLIHGAIELQAIARVHRIGQTRPTTVYMYIAADTIEENIYEISVQRRLEHMAERERQEVKGAALEETLQESILEAANSLEMEQVPMSKMLAAKKEGGEVVGKGDLWSCLFGVPGRARGSRLGGGGGGGGGDGAGRKRGGGVCAGRGGGGQDENGT